MNLAKTCSQDMLLKIIDGPEDAVIPVKSSMCLLTGAKQDQNAESRQECTICRDEHGAVVQSATEGVTINGQVAFNQRLSQGDKIQLGSQGYEVMQIGFMGKPDQDEIGSPNNEDLESAGAPKKQESESCQQVPAAIQEHGVQSNQSSEGIQKRIDKIESELGRQSENFNTVNKRFDDLSHQMSALLNAISGTNVATSESSQDACQEETSEPCEAACQFEQVELSQQSESHEFSQFEEQHLAHPEAQLPCAVENALTQLESQSEKQHVMDSENEPFSNDMPAALQKSCSSDDQAACETTDVCQDDLCLGSFGEPDCTYGGTHDCCDHESDRLELPNMETQSPDDPNTMSDQTDFPGQSTCDSATKPLTEEESERMLERLNALTSASRAAAIEKQCDTEQASLNNDDQDLQSSQNDASCDSSTEPCDRSEQLNLAQTAAHDSLMSEQEQSVEDNALEQETEQTLERLLSSLDEIDDKASDSIVVREPAASQKIDSPSMSESNDKFDAPSDESEPTESDAVVAERQQVESSELESLFSSLREKDEQADAMNELEQQQQPSESADQAVEKAIPEQAETTSQDWSLDDNSGFDFGNSSDAEQVSSGIDQMPTENETAPIAQEVSESSSLNQELASEDLSVEKPLSMEAQPTSDMAEQTEKEQPAEPASSQSSVADVLARMNMLPDEDGDQDSLESSPLSSTDETSMPESNPAVPAEETATPQQATAAGGAENAEDVQDYMNSLLQRLNNGESQTSQVVATQIQPESQPKDDKQKMSEQKLPAPVIPSEPLAPEEFVPKQTAPELNSDLAAMREIANASTRNAVRRSDLLKKKALSNNLLLMAIGGVIGAAICALMSQQTGDFFYLLAIVLFGVTALSSGIYVAVYFLKWDLAEIFRGILKGKKRTTAMKQKSPQEAEAAEVTEQ